MTSKLTGNFDLCIEISEQVLAGIAASKFAGQEFNFPINTNVSGTQVTGSVHLLTTGVNLVIDAQQKGFAAVTIAFGGSSFALTTPVKGQAAPLAGTILVKAPFKFSPLVNNQKTLQLDFAAPNCNVTVNLDSGLQQLQALLSPLGVSPGLLGSVLNQMMKGAVATTMGSVPVQQKAFTLAAAGKDGQLKTNQVSFAKLDFTTLPKGGGHPGVLAILANVLAAHNAEAGAAKKTAIATDGSHQASITISPEGFRDLFFCPGLAKTAGVKVQQLCPACGFAPFVNIKDMTVASILPVMHEGNIGVSGMAFKSGTGWDATIDYAAHITLALAQGKIVPKVIVDKVDVDFDLAWWVYLLGGFIGPAIVESGIDAYVNGIAKETFAKALGDLEPADISALAAQMTVDGVAVHPGGVVLQGKVATPAPGKLIPTLDLAEQDKGISSVPVKSGTVSNVNCTGKTYPYTDVAYTMQARLQVTPHEMGLPIAYQWTVGGVVLKTASGTVTFPAKAKGYDGKVVTSTPHVEYQLSPDSRTLYLTNYPSDGSFHVDVECTASDSLGQHKWTGTQVEFNGQQHQIGGTYAEDTADCFAKFHKVLEENGIIYTLPWPKKPIGPDPAPDVYRGMIQEERFGSFVSQQVLADLSSIARTAGIKADWLTSMHIAVPIRDIAKTRG